MKVLVTGATGRLGRALLAAIPDAIPATREEWNLDGTATDALALVRRHMPDVVIHTAAMTDTEACAREPNAATQRNEKATAALAAACRWLDARMIYISTNEVFDGTKAGAYHSRPTVAEPLPKPNPINAYGLSKYRGELAAYGVLGRSLAIVRTAWLFGGGNDFPAKIRRIADAEPKGTMPIAVTEAEVGSPTYVGDLAGALAGMARSFRPGTYHVVNGGQASRVDYARAVLAMIGSAHQVVAVQAWPRLSTPPANAVLHSDVPLRPWELALHDYLAGGPQGVSAP